MYREIYEAKRWHEDPIYHIHYRSKQFFIGDIVTVGSAETFAKVMMFLTEVVFRLCTFIRYINYSEEIQFNTSDCEDNH